MSPNANLAIRCLTILLLGDACLSPAPCQAQPDQAEIEELSQTIKQLQERLSKFSDPYSAKSGNRVTSIGSRTIDPWRPAEIQNEVQFYDLSDIFGTAPQYPARQWNELELTNPFPVDGSNRSGAGIGGGGMGGGGGVFSIPPAIEPAAEPIPAQDSTEMSSLSMESIVKVIKNTIDRNIWSGADASVSTIGKSLLISAPPETHEKIAKLFDLFRTQWGSLRTVSVQAWWIRLDALELDELVNDPASRKLQTEKGVSAIDDELWKALLGKAVKENRVDYATAITAHNAQTASAMSGGQQTFLTSIQSEFSEVADHAPAQSRPWFHHSQLQTGLLFQITPVATRGGNFVVLDLHYRILEIGDRGHNEFDILSNDEHSAISEKESAIDDLDSGAKDLALQKELMDRPEYGVQRMSTTVRCPVNQVVLTGGITVLDREGRQLKDLPKGETSTPDQLYLFVRSSVFNVVPDESDRKSKGTDAQSIPEPAEPKAAQDPEAVQEKVEPKAVQDPEAVQEKVEPKAVQEKAEPDAIQEKLLDADDHQ